VAWTDEDGTPDRVPAAAAARLLSDLNATLPDLGVEAGDVVHELVGRLPAAGPRSARLRRRPILHDHGKAGGPRGLISVAGEKYTTAPAVAARALDLAFGRASGGGRLKFLSRPPEPRIVPSYEDFRRTAEEPTARWAEKLKSLACEETAVGAEDLVLRRLDWGMEVANTDALVERVRPLLA
jgi:hypothetical protein